MTATEASGGNFARGQDGPVPRRLARDREAALMRLAEQLEREGGA